MKTKYCNVLNQRRIPTIFLSVFFHVPITANAFVLKAICWDHKKLQTLTFKETTKCIHWCGLNYKPKHDQCVWFTSRNYIFFSRY